MSGMVSRDRVLVIGATGGIGSAVARSLKAAVVPLHLIARREPALAALGAALDAPYSVVDVMDTPALTTAVADAAGDRLGGLIYAVGTLSLKPLSGTTVQDMHDALHRDVIGAFTAVKAARPALKAAGGSVVLFSSVAGRRGFPAHLAVGTAKAAVEGLTLALAADLAPDIRVNAIAPSLTRTPLAAAITDNEGMARGIATRHPLKRLGEPEDIAGLATFLLSPQAGWITGQVFAVDGGRFSVEARG